MADRDQFHRWQLNDHELVGMTPVRARDLMVRCFFEAQKETFARTRRDVGLTADLEKVENSVKGAIRSVFRDVGGDFERPSAALLERVLGVLTRSASSWGTPDDVVQFHRAQMQRVIATLKGDHAK